MIIFLYLLSGVLIFGGIIAISGNILQFTAGFGSIFTGVVILGFAVVAGEIRRLGGGEVGQGAIEQRARIIQLLNEINKGDKK